MAAFKKINTTPFLIIAAAAAILFYLVKQFFFFDEDIFITNAGSAFMQQTWQRSFLVKQVFKVQHYLFGSNPSGYHILSILLHLLNSTAAYVLFNKMLRFYNLTLVNTNTAAVAFLIFFLFTPVHSEPLSYLLAQGILIFSLLAQLSILFFLMTEKKMLYYFLSCLFFALSLLCYEISWILPVVILMLLLYTKTNTRKTMPVILKQAVPYFLILIAWFVVKYFFVSKSLVSDYENITLNNINILKLLRNEVILIIRNFTPPNNNTAAFVLTSVFTGGLILWGLIRLFLKDKRLFRFLLLLLLLVLLAVAPASLFGIDSHDSESERYIYFSSVFATMFLAVAIDGLIKNSGIKKIVIAAVSLLFGFLFFNAINNYKLAGSLSKQYVEALSKEANNVEKFFLINQPSQYKGALMLRAFTRLPQLRGEHHTVLNEYLQYLHGNTKTAFITLSKKEILYPSSKLLTVAKPFDSAVYYFNEAGLIKENTVVDKNNIVIAGLRNDTLFIFR